MHKRSPDVFERAGEQRLAEWQIGPGASIAELGRVLLRDPAADVAIARRLGAQPADESAELLRRLQRESSDKHVRKEAKRALYRLEQRGVRGPVEPVAPARAALLGVPIEGYVSAVDGRGDQLVWLVKPQPGAVAHLFAVINDPEGMREAVLNAVSRKALKSLRAELERKHALRLVAVDWHYVDFLMHRAFEWARARDTRMTGDYPGLRAQLTRLPPPQALPANVATRLALDALPIAPEVLSRSAGLLEEPEFRTWILVGDDVKPYLEELEAVRASPLVLNRMQQEERYEDVIRRAIDELFGGPLRESWPRRLQAMAYVMVETRRAARAAEAVAVARALETGIPPHQIPFCTQLVRTSLALVFQLAQEEEHEREKTSLVLTPQQVMARRARREP